MTRIAASASWLPEMHRPVHDQAIQLCRNKSRYGISYTFAVGGTPSSKGPLIEVGLWMSTGYPATAMTSSKARPATRSSRPSDRVDAETMRQVFSPRWCWRCRRRQEPHTER